MSRAFVKEDAGDEGPLPDRRISDHPNRVTPRGLAQLEARVAELEARREELGAAAAGDDLARDRLRHVERDLRYYAARLATAEVVRPPADPVGTVAFGTTVTVREEDGTRQRLTIVGEDEADREAGLLSWVSPLARELVGSRVGDRVTWKRPAGSLGLTVEAVEAVETE